MQNRNYTSTSVQSHLRLVQDRALCLCQEEVKSSDKAISKLMLTLTLPSLNLVTCLSDGPTLWAVIFWTIVKCSRASTTSSTEFYICCLIFNKSHHMLSQTSTVPHTCSSLSTVSFFQSTGLSLDSSSSCSALFAAGIYIQNSDTNSDWLQNGSWFNPFNPFMLLMK